MFHLEMNETKSILVTQRYGTEDIHILFDNQTDEFFSSHMKVLAAKINSNIDEYYFDGILKPKNIIKLVLEIFPTYTGQIDFRSYTELHKLAGLYDLYLNFIDGKLDSTINPSLGIKRFLRPQDASQINVFSSGNILATNYMNVIGKKYEISHYTDFTNEVEIIPDEVMTPNLYTEQLSVFSFRKCFKPSIISKDQKGTKRIYCFTKDGTKYNEKDIINYAKKHDIILDDETTEEELMFVYTMLALS